MRPLLFIRIRHVVLAAAGLSVAGCAKTPEPPGVCPVVALTAVPHDWQLQEARRITRNLDSLRNVVAQVDNKAARIHLIQEYLLAANQLPETAREAALSSIERVLTRRIRQ